mgnify:FL=1
MAECKICKKTYRGFFFATCICLIFGAGCHGLRTSGAPVKFKIGVIIGVTTIVAAVVFGIAGLVLLIKSKKGR